MMANKKFWLFVCLILIGGFLALAVLTRSNSKDSAQIDLLVAPSDSKVKIDGKGVKSGMTKVTPGQHLVSVTRAGFISQQQNVTVADKETHFVGIILVSNSPGTADWYKTHDADLVQSINNRLFDQISKDLVKDNPLLKVLPHIGPALTYRIDYGVPSAASKTGEPAIYVRYRTELDKQSALQWIKDQGADTTKLDIVYIQGNF